MRTAFAYAPRIALRGADGYQFRRIAVHLLVCRRFGKFIDGRRVFLNDVPQSGYVVSITDRVVRTVARAGKQNAVFQPSPYNPLGDDAVKGDKRFVLTVSRFIEKGTVRFGKYAYLVNTGILFYIQQIKQQRTHRIGISAVTVERIAARILQTGRRNPVSLESVCQPAAAPRSVFRPEYPAATVKTQVDFDPACFAQIQQTIQGTHFFRVEIAAALLPFIPFGKDLCPHGLQPHGVDPPQPLGEHFFGIMIVKDVRVDLAAVPFRTPLLRANDKLTHGVFSRLSEIGKHGEAVGPERQGNDAVLRGFAFLRRQHAIGIRYSAARQFIDVERRLSGIPAVDD